MDNFETLPIHRNKHFMKPCCAVINSEWPRSETARLHSLEESCDTLPTSLVLVKNEENNCKSIIGHSKIVPIPSIPDSGFVTSVVVLKEYRGKGLGKYLMYKTEEYMKTLGLNTVYLTTIDKQEFYSKMGYVECGPISIYGRFSGIIKNIAIVTTSSKKTFMKKPLM